MRQLFYVPLEPYKERYTVQLSAPNTGWLERNWIKHGVRYYRVDGKSVNNNQSISTGSVLDAIGRGYWCCSQIQELLILLQEGILTSDDCIYFDDFWTPGISALPYAFHLMNVHPKMYAMLHAQSVDQFDFTYPMRHWMRHFEIGMSKIFSGIFVTSTCLRDLCLYHGVGTEENVFICGLPYNSEEVKEHFPKELPKRKNNQVIFSSRWDKEKCPDFFMNVMHDYIEYNDVDVKFVITTSADVLRSNDNNLVIELYDLQKLYPSNIEIRTGLTKDEYYYSLLESKVQMNTADQDFVSWTLLEATTCGCRPLYPYFLSFPEVLDNKFLYNKGDVYHASDMLKTALDADSEDYSNIYKPFDNSWKRMLSIMQEEDYEPLYSDSN